METTRGDQLSLKSPELSYTRDFLALSTSIRRLSYVTMRAGGVGNHRNLPTAESGHPILSQWPG